MNKKNFLYLAIFLSGIFITAISCEKPASFSETDVVTITVPDYDRQSLPLLLSYRIEITNKNETKIFEENPDIKTFTLNLPNEELTSILIYPVTKPDFFLPAGCIYPNDFKKNENVSNCTPQWSSAGACILLQELLQSNNSEQIKAAELFNWTKLEETLMKKDKDSFSKFENLKTKKCTLSCNLKRDLLKSKILYPSSKITVSYFDTKSVLPEDIKDEEITDQSRLYFEYIPLNSFYKEKGWITFQVKSESKTAFLLDGKIVYISK